MKQIVLILFLKITLISLTEEVFGNKVISVTKKNVAFLFKPTFEEFEDILRPC